MNEFSTKRNYLHTFVDTCRPWTEEWKFARPTAVALRRDTDVTKIHTNSPSSKNSPMRYAIPFVFCLLTSCASGQETPQDTAPQNAQGFPPIYNTEPDLGGPLPPEVAAAGFQVPPGFEVQVFAAEPDVQNPIAMTWDSRGRLWVAENYTYAERAQKFDRGLRDRVLIFEDKDGDGRHDGRKVFTDEVQLLTSVLVGRKGVWLTCPPQLLFIPDADADDKPDGPAQVVLDGFGVPSDNYHTIANGLKWGPDGWIYGRCGASSAGLIGAPGTTDDERIPLNGGLWRFHPERKTFEAVAHGTTNPWGHDWNEVGEPFFINTVNGHFWHAFAGAHFRRPHTQDPNPRVYEVIATHADHWHWDTGQSWMDSRGGQGVHDQLGGGHAHSGCLIYLADYLPKQYHGQLFTLNLHGRRMNVERLARRGSGYQAQHEPDMLRAKDTWFRGIDVGYGPDGAIYILDWSDTGECHEHDGVHRTSGRIYRVTHGSHPSPHRGDLEAAPATRLAKLQQHTNAWYARTARRILADRSVAGEDLAAIATQLRQLYETEPETAQRLRYLWTLNAIGATDDAFLTRQLDDPDEHIRAWAIRFIRDRWPLDTVMSARPHGDQASAAAAQQLTELAREENSPLVRLILASTLQRMPIRLRSSLATTLARHGEDAEDQNIPLMVWYGLIPVADAYPSELVKVAIASKLPTVRRLIARRLAEDLETAPQPVDQLLRHSAVASAEFQSDILHGLVEGLAGWRKAEEPPAWQAAREAATQSASPQVMSLVRELSVLFGDGRALDEVKQIALDGEASLDARRSALRTLIESRAPELRSICESLLGTRFLNTVALQGLTLYDDPAIGQQLAKNYRRFHHSERHAVIDALVSRPNFAESLLNRIASGSIPRTALSPFQARQIRSFGSASLTKQLNEVWGELRESAAERQQEIATFKSQLDPQTLSAADLAQGRQLFNSACATCHRLYGHGGAVGPDLTGSGRQNIQYLLDNMVDPSAVVSADYRMSVVVLVDGRILNGIVTRETDKTVTLHTAKEEITILRSDIEETQPSKLSVMPDGLLQNMTPTQVRDLIAYLMHPTQVPLSATNAGGE